MPELGKATYFLVMDSAEFDAGLTRAEARASAVTTKIAGSFEKADASIASMGETASSTAVETDAAYASMAAGAEGAAAATEEAAAARGAADTAAAAKSAAASKMATAAWVRAGSKMQSIGRGMTRAITLPVALVTAGSIKLALDYGEKIHLLNVQAGATRREMHAASKAIMEFAASGQSTHGPKALADSMFHIESAGLRGARAVEALKTAEAGATVGGSNLEDTTNALVAAVKTAIPGATNMAEAMGTLNAIVGQGNMRMGDLTAAMTTGIVPAAKGAGLSLRDIGAAIDVFTQRGQPAQISATRLGMAIAQMQSPSKKSIGLLKEIGLGQFDLANTMRGPTGLPGAIQLLVDHLARIPDPTRRAAIVLGAFGGGRMGKAMLTLVQNSQALQHSWTEIAKHGSAAEFNRSHISAQAEAINKLRADWVKLQVVLIRFGNTALPVVTQIGAVAIKAINGFAKGVGMLPGPIKHASVALLALLALAGPMMTVMGGLITTAGRLASGVIWLAGAFYKLATAEKTAMLFQKMGLAIQFVGKQMLMVARVALTALVDGIMAASRAMMALARSEAIAAAMAAVLDFALSPIILIVGAIVLGVALLAVGFYLAYTKIKPFRDAVNGLWGLIKSGYNWIKHNWPVLGAILLGPFAVLGVLAYVFRKQIIGAVMGALNWVKHNWPMLAAILAGPFGVAVYLIVRFRQRIVGALSGALNWIENNWPALAAVLAGPFGVAAFLVYKFRNQIANFFSGIWHGAAAGMDRVADAVHDGLQKASHWLTSAATWAYTQAKRIGKAILDGIWDGMKHMGSWLGDKIKGGLHSAIKSVKSGFGIFSPSTVTSAEIGKPLAHGVIVGFANGIIGLRSGMIHGINHAASGAAQAASRDGAMVGAAFGNAFSRAAIGSMKIPVTKTTLGGAIVPWAGAGLAQKPEKGFWPKPPPFDPHLGHGVALVRTRGNQAIADAQNLRRQGATDLETYQHLIAMGYTPKQAGNATRQTKEGERYGFHPTKVKITQKRNTAGGGEGNVNKSADLSLKAQHRIDVAQRQVDLAKEGTARWKHSMHGLIDTQLAAIAELRAKLRRTRSREVRNQLYTEISDLLVGVKGEREQLSGKMSSGGGTSSTDRFWTPKLRIALAKAERTKTTADDIKVYEAEKRHLLYLEKHTKNLKERAAIEEKITSVDKKIASLRGKATGMVDPSLWTPKLRIALAKAERTKTTADDIKVYEAEKQHLAALLRHTKDVNARAKIEEEITSVDKKLASLRGKQVDQTSKSISAAQVQAAMDLRGTFFGEFAPNIFHRGPEGLEIGPGSGTSKPASSDDEEETAAPPQPKSKSLLESSTPTPPKPRTDKPQQPAAVRLLESATARKRVRRPAARKPADGVRRQPAPTPARQKPADVKVQQPAVVRLLESATRRKRVVQATARKIADRLTQPQPAPVRLLESATSRKRVERAAPLKLADGVKQAQPTAIRLLENATSRKRVKTAAPQKRSPVTRLLETATGRKRVEPVRKPAAMPGMETPVGQKRAAAVAEPTLKPPQTKAVESAGKAVEKAATKPNKVEKIVIDHASIHVGVAKFLIDHKERRPAETAHREAVRHLRDVNAHFHYNEIPKDRFAASKKMRRAVAGALDF